MHVHILGICGTFMGGLALLARAQGHRVTGSDANVYPPMSTQLQEQGIELIEGYDPSQLNPEPDLVVIGNAMSRGNPCVEAVLERGMAYTSGPQFLCDHVLPGRWVLAVSGTHGKTTTASMLAWLLEDNQLAPGFLIGGVPQEFGVSARMGDTPFFVVEADEYDSAFFDKRSKFVHYRPRTLLINNLEFDHADIFDSLADIQRQFHHLVRTVPGSGQVIWPQHDAAVAEVLARGCWSEQMVIGPAGWHARKLREDGSQFEVLLADEPLGTVNWNLMGDHNIDNALGALAAARHVGVRPADGIASLARFAGPKRRMELRGEAAGVALYDDFAHHPTAIATTLSGLRARLGSDRRILAVLEPRSNTMKQGVHQGTLAASLEAADCAYVFEPQGLGWDIGSAMAEAPVPVQVSDSVEGLIDAIVGEAQPGDTILVMSNGGFEGIHTRLLAALERNHDKA
ncbi:UDP-N-acetylmuramate:L-alanyl-gamma-D-glutamyl-meso-diaminopimelate ligase [Ferrimonas balearica]|uniref:UDP-N-acetylmuramate:L-alanyl-gamma-D-glutamyl- meso-diaminopimelate ligase n=1 Tax=Ferrimonas balearica TaxID=44012 RepID=UPI001C991EA5|nr:UDP-N-acetylmuramate:L-alanyl-gamma-D-glutamyl-meso-diaminopimelate ligase [Ferrimonas balearica]MBY5922998.1 UDP-N-acetylmuramate:L-alanyl-gamma-D-glutamyl-meso-diaminopimelate ligase [Ferrimonas balearica]MBY5997625.1 UDP-N-acetylmuramate:L-alanyl-gamma-D-glutamyl-meso-diaminopimelate ligase [Ferrimonas balearica]